MWLVAPRGKIPLTRREGEGGAERPIYSACLALSVEELHLLPKCLSDRWRSIPHNVQCRPGKGNLHRRLLEFLVEAFRFLSSLFMEAIISPTLWNGP